MNMMGKAKVINEPRKIATPNRMDIIPRYMGCLLNLNGPEVTRVFGISYGLTVVCFFLKSESVQRFIITPKIISPNPK